MDQQMAPRMPKVVLMMGMSISEGSSGRSSCAHQRCGFTRPSARTKVLENEHA